MDSYESAANSSQTAILYLNNCFEHYILNHCSSSQPVSNASVTQRYFKSNSQQPTAQIEIPAVKSKVYFIYPEKANLIYSIETMNKSGLLAGSISGKTQLLMNEPTRIKSGQMKFLILDMPNNNNLYSYIQEMNDYKVQHLVRTCNGDYTTDPIIEANIEVHDLFFEDGGHPPLDIIKKWQQIVKASIKNNGAVAVHCIAGLGRAPTLVGISLIDYGMDPTKAIDTIRAARRGSLNSKQISFLLKYKKPSCMNICRVS